VERRIYAAANDSVSGPGNRRREIRLPFPRRWLFHSPQRVTDHDQIFKHLLQNFFSEFLAAFVPELHRDLEANSIQFLDKELIRARGQRRQTKLVDSRAVSRRGELHTSIMTK